VIRRETDDDEGQLFNKRLGKTVSAPESDELFEASKDGQAAEINATRKTAQGSDEVKGKRETSIGLQGV